MKGLIAVIIALVILGSGYYWYTSQQGTAPENSMTDITSIPSVPTPSPSGTTDTSSNTSTGTQTSTAKEFTVSGKNFSFAPATMTVQKGDRVRITFVNESGTHNLRVDGYNVGTQVIQGGARETFEFTADTKGTFEYYCSVDEHRQMGMKGTLTVQ